MLSFLLFSFLTCVIILAILGKGFGVRRLYIRILLAVFEYGSRKIKAKSKGISEQDGDEARPLLDHSSRRQPRTRRMSQTPEEMQKCGFCLDDAMSFFRNGVEAIIEDEVTQSFDAAELSSWNLLTRTTTGHQFISVRLTVLYLVGCFLRYFILFPFRAFLTIFSIGFMMCLTALVGNLPVRPKLKKKLNYNATLTWARLMSRAFSAVITFHNRENKAVGGGICVANHTSPIDIILMCCDNSYAMVGQAHGGFVGMLQKSFSRATHHIWFQRSESKDRSAVARRLREHVEDVNKEPILIFPEGTCVNNTSIMMFKKGSFEVGGKIYPAAIKYDPKFADPFWNSSKQSFPRYLLMLLSSWALVVDIWYLPPMTREKNEDAVAFANRVKSEIALQGGLVDLDWDGGLKRSRPKDTMKESLQRAFSMTIKEE